MSSSTAGKDSEESLSTDVVIIGSGAAGLSVAIHLPETLQVLLVSRSDLKEGCSYYAQGGIACVKDPADSVESHVKDTLFAGAGLCNEKLVRILASDGPAIIQAITSDVTFDHAPDGQLLLGHEGAHSHRRILHAGGDATGKALVLGLQRRLARHKNVKILEHGRVLGFDKESSALRIWKHREDKIIQVQARQVVLATGGYSQLYQETTNPSTSTGDGIRLALDAGAEIMDMEFVQFHPTALFVAGAPRFLISEAVRGDGAILRNASGHPFMREYHELADLAPRDVVSRAILHEMIRGRESCAFLDLSHLKPAKVYERFPTIRAVCRDYELDLARQWIPVRPAAHYTMGGVRTDEWGRTRTPGLYACGEVAATGVHGANRLASNSLLEGLVFGARVARSIAEEGQNFRYDEDTSASQGDDRIVEELDSDDLLNTLKSLMWRNVGVLRDRSQLLAARRRLSYWLNIRLRPQLITHSWLNFRSLKWVAWAVCKSALARQESRGAHWRDDFPETDDPNYLRHLCDDRTTLLKDLQP